VSERTPALRNMHLSDITVKGAPVAGFILGLPEMPVENVTFNNVNIEAEKGFSCKDAKNIAFKDVQINTKKGPALICENTVRLEVEGSQPSRLMRRMPWWISTMSRMPSSTAAGRPPGRRPSFNCEERRLGHPAADK